MPRSKNYREYLIKKLRDPKKAIDYLNAALEDCKDGSPESKRVLLRAFKTILQAQKKGLLVVANFAATAAKF